MKEEVVIEPTWPNRFGSFFLTSPAFLLGAVFWVGSYNLIRKDSFWAFATATVATICTVGSLLNLLKPSRITLSKILLVEQGFQRVAISWPDIIDIVTGAEHYKWYFRETITISYHRRDAKGVTSRQDIKIYSPKLLSAEKIVSQINEYKAKFTN